MAEEGVRSVLVVDNDMTVLQKVEKTLPKTEYEVQLATDGALAINRALAAPPDLVISAVEMPLLDGFKLCQLLRTNPLSRDIPFIFLTSKETSPQRLGKFLRPFDEFLLKPFKESELLTRISDLFSRMEKMEEVAEGGGQALLGTLSEITLMDLLQIMRLNRRSGLLDLEQEGRLGTVFLREGEVINAKLGKFKGEKAFFRVLDWNRGKFEFRPISVDTDVLITRPGENLILEGLRQLDEINKIKDSILSKGTRLELVKRFQGPPDRLRPVTREVLKLLEYFSTLEDILDQSSYNDLEISQSIQSLVEKQIVALSTGSEEGKTESETPILTLEEALKMSYQLGVGREETSQSWTGKILVFTDNRKSLQQLLEGLSRLKEFKIEASVVLDSGSDVIPMGTVGSIQILEGTEVQMYCFPSDASYRPLWEPLSQGTVGALILATSVKPVKNAAAFCDDFLNRPFLLAGPKVKEEKEAAEKVWEWTPKVAWDVTTQDNGKKETCRETFRKLFTIILSQ